MCLLCWGEVAVFVIASRWRERGTRTCRAFKTVDCFVFLRTLAMTRKYFGGATLVALIVSLRASTTCERGNQPCWAFIDVRLLRLKPRNDKNKNTIILKHNNGQPNKQRIRPRRGGTSYRLKYTTISSQKSRNLTYNTHRGFL